MSSTLSLNAANPFVRQMSETLGVQQAGVSITLMSRGGLADSTEVFMVKDAGERPRAVVVLSPQAAPDMVDRATSRARGVAGLIGPQLSRRILLPTMAGRLEGRSYAVMPYCERLSTVRPVWWLQRLKVRPVIMKWLEDVARSSLRSVSDSNLAASYEKPLALLAAEKRCSAELRSAAKRALSKFSDGSLRPLQVAMHGDIWTGNIMVRGRGRGPGATRFDDRVTLIDWAGARLDGYPLYDLVRAAGSLRVAPAVLNTAVRRHCDLLECDVDQSVDYLVAALGGILATIENFPIENFARMAEQSYSDLCEAIGAGRG